MTAGAISAATHRAGTSAPGTIVQAVVVNGQVAIPGNVPVTMKVVAAADGLTVQLAGMTINGETVAVGSSQMTLDPQTAAGNAVIERALEAMRARSRGAAPPALAARLAVASGPNMNLPSGARLLFTLSAPISVPGVAAPRVR
jgi:hypothetical protein